MECFHGPLLVFNVFGIGFYLIPCTFQREFPDFNQVIDGLQVLDVLFGINPVALPVFPRRQMGEFRFPKPDQGSVHAQQVADFPDGVIFLGDFSRFGHGSIHGFVVLPGLAFEVNIGFSRKVGEEEVNRIDFLSVFLHFVVEVGAFA